MTNVTRIKTDAEQTLEQQILSPSLAGNPLRAAGRELFASTGLPHRRVEEYKYTDLKALMRKANPVAGETTPQALASVVETLRTTARAGEIRLVILDGLFRADISDLAALPDGVTVTSLRDVLAKGAADTMAVLAGPAIASNDPVISLNAALVSDGVVIEVAAGAMIADALHLVHIVTSATPVSLHTRSAVILGAGASLGLIESYQSTVPGHQRTDVLNVVVGDGARFEHAVAKSDASAIDLATITAVIGADAKLQSFALVTAGDVTRRQHFVRMEGNHSVLSLKGANLLNGRMHADTTLVVEHDSLDCESRELYRSVIDGEAHGVFQGKVIVRPGAQKTDGKMASNALLLSESAEMHNKPELEIYADDVACGHGATCGEIDEGPIFYLMSRGLTRAQAEALLIQSFVGEVVDSVGDVALGDHAEALRDGFTAAIEAWLAQRGAS